MGLNYRSRITILDNNKTCFEYIGDKSSDYIVVDIADVRLSVADYDGGSVSYTGFIISNLKEFERIYGEVSVRSYDEFSDDEWERCIRYYCRRILELYNPNQIILNEVMLQNEYVSKQGMISSFPTLRKQRTMRVNSLLNRLYHICEKELEGCHVLRMPQGVIADASHKFGLHPLHFHKLYYEYGINAMKIVADELSQKKERLNDLCLLYSEKFSVLKLQLQNKRYVFDNRKLNVYMEYFLYLLQHPVESLDNVKEFVKENRIHHVALFGDFKTTEALIFYLGKVGVSVDYIIGYWNNHKDLKLVHPVKNGGCYPETDAIINCSIMNLKNGSNNLRKTTSIRVFDIYEVLSWKGES